MLRISTDFSKPTHSGAFAALCCGPAPVSEGMVWMWERVVLCQDGAEYEVEATLEYDCRSGAQNGFWLAIPDWATKRRVQ